MFEVVVVPECGELALQIHRVSQQHLIEKLLSSGADEPFHKRVGSRRIRNRFELVDFKNPEIRFPAMKLEQRVVVRTELAGDSLSGDGMIKPLAQRYPIYLTCLNAKTDYAPSELIHYDADPMCPQWDGFTAKEINASKVILHVADEREPGRAARTMLWSIVAGQHPADHILVDLHAEGSPNDERNPQAAEAWISAFQPDDCVYQLV